MDIFKTLDLLADVKYLALVQFRNDSTGELSKACTYKIPNSISLTVGDLVIIKVYDAFKLAIVRKVEENTAANRPQVPLSWIAQRVDTSKYDEILAQEAEIVAALTAAQDEAIRKEAVKALNEHFAGTPAAKRKLAAAVKRLNASIA